MSQTRKMRRKMAVRGEITRKSEIYYNDILNVKNNIFLCKSINLLITTTECLL